MYKIGDVVKFYPNISTNQAFVGKIEDVSREFENGYQYKIKYEDSFFYIYEKFIICKMENVKSHDETSPDNKLKYQVMLLGKINGVLVNNYNQMLIQNEFLVNQLEKELKLEEGLENEINGLKEEYQTVYKAFRDAQKTIVNLKSEISKYEKIKTFVITRDCMRR